MRAFAIFADPSPHWAAPLLKQNYRHVWAVIEDERAQQWIEVNLTLSHGLSIRAFAASDYDVAGFYRNLGFEVISLHIEPADHIRLPLMWTHCVAITKAVLGISNPLIWTPWQLRQYLMRSMEVGPCSPRDFDGSAATP